MTSSTDRFFVLTGGPGSGKTSLIEALAAQGHVTAPEAGRAIIRDQMAIGGPALPWADRQLFAELMLAWECRSHHWAQSQQGLVFFDRGVPDVLGYLALCDLPAPPHAVEAAAKFRYNAKVFALPPWPDIFANDSERRQDLDEAARTYDAVTAAYRRHGYAIVDVPRVSIAQRLRFILAATG